jgi:predicted RNase H-like nuclease (RuvC/YqgF family)
VDSGNWAAIIVATLSLLAGLYTARTASKASISSTKTQAETEAYNRARKMDTETIEKQEKKIEKLEARVEHLEEQNDMLEQDNDRLRNRINRLENLEKRLRDLGYSVD